MNEFLLVYGTGLQNLQVKSAKTAYSIAFHKKTCSFCRLISRFGRLYVIHLQFLQVVLKQCDYR
jgi:ribosomal protein L36